MGARKKSAISKDKNLAVYAKHTGADDLRGWVRKVFQGGANRLVFNQYLNRFYD